MTSVAIALATFGYVGYFPIAPGTAGSLAALVLFGAVRLAGMPALELGVILAVFVVGTWAAGITERALGQKDPGPIVIDEVLGMLIALALVPASAATVVVGFLLFRVFDVVKPYPAGRLEDVRGGLGVMLDDAVAGAYAHLALSLLIVVAPSWMGA